MQAETDEEPVAVVIISPTDELSVGVPILHESQRLARARRLEDQPDDDPLLRAQAHEEEVAPRRMPIWRRFCLMASVGFGVSGSVFLASLIVNLRRNATR